MNETQQKPRLLTSFTSMFEEIKDNYGIDILKYDSFEDFMIAFFSLLSPEQFKSFNLPTELAYVKNAIEKMKIA